MVSPKGVRERRSRNSACCNRKTNILDSEYRVGSWNYMRAATQPKHGLAHFCR